MGTHDELAAVFGLPAEAVRVINPFVGGGFGSGLRCWPHSVVAALAARETKRPVKLVLSRKQMYFGTGFRPSYEYRLRLGSDRRGRLTAAIHDIDAETSSYETFTEAVMGAGQMTYSMPNVSQAYRTAPLDVNTPIWMRGPGFASASFAIESAMDELAHKLGIDPIELRRRNEPNEDESSPSAARVLHRRRPRVRLAAPLRPATFEARGRLADRPGDGGRRLRSRALPRAGQGPPGCRRHRCGRGGHQ
jgi:xanthine dehydrogenase YagR molybdenum-binding subunit